MALFDRLRGRGSDEWQPPRKTRAERRLDAEYGAHLNAQVRAVLLAGETIRTAPIMAMPAETMRDRQTPGQGTWYVTSHRLLVVRARGSEVISYEGRAFIQVEHVPFSQGRQGGTLAVTMADGTKITGVFFEDTEPVAEWLMALWRATQVLDGQ